MIEKIQPYPSNDGSRYHIVEEFSTRQRIRNHANRIWAESSMTSIFSKFFC